MRKYQACVFYMPILLRICLSESATRCKSFLGQLRKTRKKHHNRILYISDRQLVRKWSGQCAYVWKQISGKVCLDSPITFQVTGSNARLPICLVSGNPAERLGDEWVQTRGYQACVVYMPIPLRVCLARAAQEVRGTSDLRGPEWNVEPRDAKSFF